MVQTKYQMKNINHVNIRVGFFFLFESDFDKAQKSCGQKQSFLCGGPIPNPYLYFCILLRTFEKEFMVVSECYVKSNFYFFFGKVG